SREDMESRNFSGKTIALFARCEQQGYRQWFQDAGGMLHEKINPQGVTFLGYWPNSDDYEFEASKALTEDGTQFVGLAVDEDSLYEKSAARISTWVGQVMT
ncbi:flavodoxin FldB, partial [Pseudoalteromonas spongiae]